MHIFQNYTKNITYQANMFIYLSKTFYLISFFLSDVTSLSISS